MIKSYTKKPVVIQALQWTGSNLEEIITFTDGSPDVRSEHADMKWEEYKDLVEKEGLKIYTLEGKMSANVGTISLRVSVGNSTLANKTFLKKLTRRYKYETIQRRSDCKSNRKYILP